MKKLLLDQIRRKIDKAQVISFDIFDTLLVRPYVAPTDLFVHMEKAYARPGFASERRVAERRTHIRHKELEDITFDMIYEEIDAEYRDLKQKELDWEAMVLRPNPELKQVYDYALAQGKRIIIASDMYLPTEFIASILRKNGFDRWEKLYVSGDIGKWKRGSLFCHILDEIGVRGNEILHIGDNINWDYKRSLEFGIIPILTRKVVDAYVEENEKARIFLEQNRRDFTASVLTGLFAYHWQKQRCAQESIDDYWCDLGFQYTGPLAYGFGRFVHKKAQDDHIKNLLFISRSGYVLKKVFDCMQTGIQTHYVYSPRIIKYICNLDIDDPRLEYDKLVKYFCNKSPVLKEKYSKLPVKIEDKSERKGDFIRRANSNRLILKSFLDSNRDVIKEIVSQNKVWYDNYLATAIEENKDYAIVDDMARYFTAQANIESYMNKKLKGYYINVMNSNLCQQFDNAGFHEQVGIRAVSSKDVNCRSWCWEFIEFLVSAPEAPVADVSENGICLSDEIDEGEKARILTAGKLCDGAQMFAGFVRDIFGDYDIYLNYSTIICWINVFLLNPSRVDYKNFSKVRYALSGFGSDSLPLLVRRKRFKEYFIANHKLITPHVDFYWNMNMGVIWDKEKKHDMKCVRLFCIPIYRRFSYGGGVKAKILGGLVSIKKTRELKKISVLRVTVYKKEKKKGLYRTRILGIPCGGDKKRDKWNDIKGYISLQREHTDYLIKAQNVHAHFKKYWKCHTGQSVVLIAPGPTAKYYETLQHLPHIGANGSIYMEKVKLDYLFVQDHPVNRKDARLSDLDADALKYEGNNCKKFFAILSDYRLNIIKDKVDRIPLHYADNVNVFNYYLDPICRGPIAWDISTDLFADHVGTVLSAMQFILYTNPKRIYVVGCDCSSGHMFKEDEENYSWQISGWKLLAEFARRYYPETEIISINPVGLKGLFNDVYTKSYLRKHPEINPASVAIMEEEV